MSEKEKQKKKETYSAFEANKGSEEKKREEKGEGEKRDEERGKNGEVWR